MPQRELIVRGEDVVEQPFFKMRLGKKKHVLKIQLLEMEFKCAS